jgi:acetylornithine deacetylase/succinyl-diaminopimelate desuccinylase-like protein
MKPRIFIALVLSLVVSAEAQTPVPHQQLARDVFKQLIEINTTHSIGDTSVAAEAMSARLRAAGFPAADIFLGGPVLRKGNLVARYRGRNATLKPLLLLAHLDVVEAAKTDWSPDLDPFKLIEKDSFFYGRGTSDDKAMAAIFVACRRVRRSIRISRSRSPTRAGTAPSRKRRTRSINSRKRSSKSQSTPSR